MSASLLQFLIPGTVPVDGFDHATFSWTGLNPGWALILWIALLVLIGWSYRRYAPRLSRTRRGVLAALRIALVGILLVILAGPVLNLEIKDHTRRTIAVLIDSSQSMTLADGRTEAEDLKRAAIATGKPESSADLPRITRVELLNKLAANKSLDLWSKLHAKSDIELFTFGKTLESQGPLFTPARPANAENAAVVFQTIRHDNNLTAVGDALYEILNRKRGQSLAGILVITDGANNTGSVPVEAARLAKQDNVPLYLYGVGITRPRDLAVIEVNGPQLSLLKDRAIFNTRIHATGLVGQSARVTLFANDKKVAESTLKIARDGEETVALDFVPEAVGEVSLKVVVDPLPGESVAENNTSTASTRVVDQKIRILYVEGAPRWDYRYLLALLQRDRRIEVQVVVTAGDPGLSGLPNSVFLDAIPEDRNRLLSYDAILIGDVNPELLGATRMELLSEWVEQKGGGLAFLAGPDFTPSAYARTPWERLLPVELDSSAKVSAHYVDPVSLKLTPAGERSAILQMTEDAKTNQELWAAFPGVTWTARVGRTRPAAQSLLVDPNPDRATRSGPTAVLAIQPYGLGQVAYVGTDQTYRWRSKAAERHHTRIWGQLIQALTAGRQHDGSQFVQIKTDRARYVVGDRVVITTRAADANLIPLTDSTLPGTLSIQASPAAAPQLSELRLSALSGRPGEYRGEFIARLAGGYTFTAVRDPAAIAKFEVIEPRVELSATAMNEPLLRAMSDAAGGRFLREEDLAGLPELVSSGTADIPTFKAVNLSLSPWLLGLLVLVASLEWWIRRRSELK